MTDAVPFHRSTVENWARRRNIDPAFVVEFVEQEPDMKVIEDE